MDLIVGSKYRLGTKIRCGFFGDTYLGTHIESNENVAVKLEPITCEDPHLMHESKIYKILAGAIGAGIPKLHWYGVEGDFNVIVVDLLGPSLQDLLDECQHHFSLKTLVMLADQMVNRVEYIHRRNFIHRDISPGSFVMGLGEKAKHVHIIDFGLARKYRTASSEQHIAYEERDTFTGSFEFLSLNAQRGVEQTRRDDLESLAYVLMHCQCGGLPWEKVEAASEKEWRRKVSEVKMRTPIEDLCRNIPHEFAIFLNYCRSLTFEAEPDYSHLRILLKRIFTREGYKYDFAFDWQIVQGTTAFLSQDSPASRQEIALTGPIQKTTAHIDNTPDASSTCAGTTSTCEGIDSDVRPDTDACDVVAGPYAPEPSSAPLSLRRRSFKPGFALQVGIQF